MVIALCLLAGCPSAEEDRLIPRDDSQFRALETPESDGECTESSDCEDSCVHSCVPTPKGPMTCPVEPIALPDRLVGGMCVCAESQRCKWL